MSTRRVHTRSGNHYDVFIGYPSKWANPYRHVRPRAVAVRLFRDYIIKRTDLLGDLPELYDKILGCPGCHSGQLCHGDVLLCLIDERRAHEQPTEVFATLADRVLRRET